MHLPKTSIALLWMLLAHSSWSTQDYPETIKPIIEQRCMVCHGCYDAPCQLKLDAFAGLERGANQDVVYDGARLRTAKLTRLEDGHSAQQWKKLGFYPVLDEADYRQGQLYRLLQLKREHPLPAGNQLPDSFDFRLNRDQQCAKADEFDLFEKEKPLWGMPYGLPGVPDAEHQQLTQWLQAGAPGVQRPPPDAATQQTIDTWEQFFNGESLKQQLVARYIFEHLYVADLHFPDQPAAGFFRLVRSRTPSGQPVEPIATRRVYDSPGKGKFYYRLQVLQTSPLKKRHMPYALNEQRMQRWQQLFFEPAYTVDKLPDYKLVNASNPFKTFYKLPVRSRYKFMLDEAQFTIMGFIKGPVCRGQIALSVIEDHFWVMFVDPDSQDPELNAEFLHRERNNLRLPVSDSGMLISLVQWRKYASAQRRYLEAKSIYLTELTDKHKMQLNEALIWNGEGHNDNATLTIFRHFNSASVVKGMIGDVPKTAWVVSYSLLERIHYLLVAGFDVYGNVAHQLESRLYMDFLRMEGEYNFLVLLPEKDRLALRDYWYRGASDHVKEYVMGSRAWFNRDTDMQFTTDDPKRELLLRLKSRLPGADSDRYRINKQQLQKLQEGPRIAYSFMPNVVFVDVLDDGGKPEVYSLIRNSGHSNIAYLFDEQKRRLPNEDTLTVARGFIGAYPNQFFQVNAHELGTFVKSITELRSEADYRLLLDRYGVRRNASWFWAISDKLHRIQRREQPVEAGLFDYNRYDNR
jgi:hypothetical protein